MKKSPFLTVKWLSAPLARPSRAVLACTSKRLAPHSLIGRTSKGRFKSNFWLAGSGTAVSCFPCSRQLVLDRSDRVFIIWSKRIRTLHAGTKTDAYHLAIPIACFGRWMNRHLSLELMKFGKTWKRSLYWGQIHDRDLRKKVPLKRLKERGMTTYKAQANTSRPEEARLRLPDPGHNLPRDGEPLASPFAPILLACLPIALLS
ncbi:hypothetical protein HAX54_033386 [Datura stramonium]|uniref:Uncharacterized protein n=1 Tax=Datura stramonium TaxID=4076 RepID=A0ABS8VEZ2_DATST|nr:hypothetical protein [Datura stramonium]